jgi:hypothetical protein
MEAVCSSGEHINPHHCENLAYCITGKFYTTEKDAVIKCYFYCTFKGESLFIYTNKYVFIIVRGKLWVTLNNMNKYFKDY